MFLDPDTCNRDIDNNILKQLEQHSNDKSDFIFSLPFHIIIHKITSKLDVKISNVFPQMK